MTFTDRKKRSTKQALLASVFLGLISPVAAFADAVVLKSADGSINIEGDLVDFNDEFYVLRTTLGDLRVGVERVRCEGEGCPVVETVDADVKIAGSDTVGLGLMPLLMEGYASYLDAEASVIPTQTEGEVVASFVADGGFGDDLASYRVTSTSSGDAFTNLLEGNSHLGMSSRRITPAEARELKAAGAGNMVSPSQENIVAVDGLVLITHPSNSISQISIEQMRGIYAGEFTNWSQLGGADMPITLVSRQEGSGTRAVFEERMLVDAGVEKIEDFKVANDNVEMAAMVTDTPGAIGYVGFAFQRGAKPMTLVNECGIPTAPDSFSAKTEEYALQRRLYLYNRGDVADENVDSFLDFAISEQADGVIRKAGFIDLGIEVRNQGADTPRAVNLTAAELDDYERQFADQMLAQMGEYDRLSTTFRFRTGSSRLDERGLLDMGRLMRYLEGQPEGTEVALVGFTDDVGAFDANKLLAAERASAVMEQIMGLSPELAERVTFVSKGYGEISPVACNISDQGRSINRRVEVWIKSQA